jgi:cytochrome P450
MTSSQLSATAVYKSPLPAPSDRKTFTYALETASTPSENLKKLREATAAMQDEVNKYLTERMEEEKKQLEASNIKLKEEDEDKYGEEEAGDEE